MKTARFVDETGRELTLKKAAPEWYNEDLPTIWRKSDGYKMWHGWSVHSGIEIDVDDSDYNLVQKFIASSRKAFLKKYPHCKAVV